MATELDLNESIVLNAVFAKIDKTAFSLSLGIIFFLSMFLVTAISIIKGNASNPIAGPELAALNYYLPGYNLSWYGNIIGSAYMSVIGAILGWFFGALWNLTHYLYLAILMNKINLFKID
ncbi:hypothetical protein [Cycloclasticus zancles]|uniref:Uncharacterized protein n=1 Tax=Cycloclasticus zancles 78-ME TaxID=1198232 RepID=S5TG32_9GAMM|nr:hypothetical protein [Cycloclasticus zancles]AGS39782.1 hypothetical protein CYCME_1454 [Cycloclasticus zancles 78-ME]